MGVRNLWMRRGVVAGLAIIGAGLSSITVHATDIAEEIEKIRLAVEEYQDVNAALAAGYIRDPHDKCVSAESEGLQAELGSMGIHYLRPDLLGITATEPRVNGTGVHTDFLNPPILLYEPQADGSLSLVGVEGLVFEKAWTEAGNTDSPVFLGRQWDHMADDPNTARDEAHGFEPHYDQHVWFRGEPKYVMMPYNPAITCQHFKKKH